MSRFRVIGNAEIFVSAVSGGLGHLLKGGSSVGPVGMAVENAAMEGAYNGVAPHPVTNRELTKAIADAVQKPIIFPAIPALLLKLLLGEMADLVLRGSKVSSAKIQKAGYVFVYGKAEDALANLLQKNA